MRRAIIGAGIGGLSLAKAFLEAGIGASQMAVIDAGSEHRASAAPVAMVHPFQGRSMALRRGQGEAFLRSWEILEGWARESGGKWWQKQPMVRPLSKDQRGQIMEESWLEDRKHYSGPIKVEYMEPEELAARFEGVKFDVPGLVYGPAAAVDLAKLLEALRPSVQEEGVEFVDAQMVGLARKEGKWAVQLSTGEELVFEEVILAVGAALEQFFPLLDMRRRAGELAILDPGEASLPVMLSVSKHLVELPGGLWGLGSTYYSAQQEPHRDDKQVLDELLAGVVEMVPAVMDAKILEIWRGERSVYGADYLPLIGTIPEQPGLYCFGAFGSKGLLWAPSAAQDLVREVISGERALSAYAALRRIRAEKLTLPPVRAQAQKSNSSTRKWKLSGISC